MAYVKFTITVQPEGRGGVLLYTVFSSADEMQQTAGPRPPPSGLSLQWLGHSAEAVCLF